MIMKTKEWYNRKSKDVYIKKASKLGYVSRSAFKLIEIEKKFKLIKSSSSILEFGSAPGGWTQVISNIKLNDNYILVSIDKNDLEISTNKNVFFIKKNFSVYADINKEIKKVYKNKFDLILSDMSPNTTGHSNTDHLQIIQIAEEVLQFSMDNINKHGNLIIKIFQGLHEKDLVLRLKEKFLSVNYFKPRSSRKNSAEIYLISLNYKFL